MFVVMMGVAFCSIGEWASTTICQPSEAFHSCVPGETNGVVLYDNGNTLTRLPPAGL